MSTMTMSTEFLRRPDSGDAVGFGRSKSNSFSSFFSDRKQGSLASWRPSVASSSPPISNTEVALTDGNFNLTSCYGARTLHLKSCTQRIETRTSLSFSGTIVRLELDGLSLPHNLILILLTGCYLQEIKFSLIRMKEPFAHDGKIIAPSIKSIIFVGHLGNKSLTRDEGTVLSFMLNSVIFRKLASISFYTHKDKDQCETSCLLDRLTKKRKLMAAEALTKLCLQNSDTLDQVKLDLPASGSNNFQVIFEDMNAGVEFAFECRNRLFRFMALPSTPSGLQKLAKLQFSTLEVLTGGLKTVLFDVLAFQKSLKNFTYLEQAKEDGRDHLDDVFAAVRACSDTLSEITIVIGGGMIEVRSDFYAKQVSLRTFTDCKVLKRLTFMLNRSKSIIDTDALPKRIEFLSIIGVMGKQEIPKLFNDIKSNCENLVSLQFQNNLFASEGPRLRYSEQKYYQHGNLITVEMITDLFQCSQLRRVLVCDRRLPTAQVKTAFSNLYGVNVKQFANNYGNGVSIFARISNASEFEFRAGS